METFRKIHQDYLWGSTRLCPGPTAFLISLVWILVHKIISSFADDTQIYDSLSAGIYTLCHFLKSSRSN